ncbi:MULTISPECIES: tetratricopeptide repeat protein [Streptomyces]|uniref:tetratricopeptide repeat protein n=1 Tax=Streptomyces TaxID=1883 RepID=UPI000B9DE242|nr:tetratricopeptide repeat protein [Streptomyces kasugaensis]
MEFLFHVRGVGGVGKSSLVRHWQGTARARGAVTAVVDEVEVRGVVEAMEAICAQLGQQAGGLKAFSAALERYRREREDRRSSMEQAGEHEEGSGGREGDVSASSRVIAQATLGGAALLPGGSVLASLASPEVAAQGLERVRSGIREQRGRRERGRLAQDPVRALTEAFVQELGRLAGEHEWVVLFFDTWEQTGRYLEVWVRDLLLDEYGPLPANTVMVLAGQNELSEREWAELSGQISEVRLEVFTEQETRALLAARGVSDEAVIEEILRLSMGLPLLVDTLAHIRPSSPGGLADAEASADVAVARFVRWIPDPNEQATVLSCALPLQLNEDIFHAAAPETAAGLYGWLCRQPFVTGHGSHRKYHDVVRASMLRHLRTRSPLVWTEHHTRLTDAYTAWRTTAGEHLSHSACWADPDWREHRLNEIYHRLCAHPTYHLTTMIEDTVHAAGQDLATMRHWIDMLARSAQDTAHPDLVQWSERLTTAAAGDRPLLDTLPVLLTTPGLTATARAWAHIHRGWYLYRDDRGEEAIAAFGQATAADPTLTEAHIGHGVTCRWSRRYDQAIADLTRAAELDPANVQAFTHRGTTHQIMGRYDEALTDHTRAIELNPHDHRQLTHRALTYQVMGRYEEALADHNRAIELKPHDHWPLTNRALTYQAMGRYDEALTDRTRAIELNPHDHWPLTHRALTYRLASRYNDALVDLNRAIELEPDQHWLLTERAAIYRVMGRYEEALTDHNRAIELEPDHHRPLAERAQTHRNMGHYDQALTDITRAIELSPADARAHYHRAQIYRAMGRYDEALADHTRAIELNPHDHWPVTERAQTHREMGHYDEALADHNRAIELHPHDHWPLSFRALAFQAMGRYEEALADHNRAIGLNPDHHWPVTDRAAVYRAMDRYEEALTDHTRAIELNPHDHWPVTSRAITFQDMGHYDQALTDHDHAIELAPFNARAHDHRALTYRAMGHYEEALTDHTRAIELAPHDDWPFNGRAHVHLLLGRYDDALADCRRAMEIDPRDTRHQCLYAIAVRRAGGSQAASYLQRVIRIITARTVRDSPKAAEEARGAVFLMYCAAPDWERAATALDAILSKRPAPHSIRQTVRDLSFMQQLFPETAARLAAFTTRLQEPGA